MNYFILLNKLLITFCKALIQGKYLLEMNDHINIFLNKFGELILCHIGLEDRTYRL